MGMIEEKIYAGVDLKTRLVMPPMASEGAYEGKVSDGMVAYYKKMAKNKHFGLFIVEHSYVERRGKASEKQLSISEDEDIEGHRRIVQTIHGENPDARVFLQINHAGIKTRRAYSKEDPIAPSIRPWDKANQAMREEDLNRVKEAFVSAALRAKKAGYDGVELHVAHGYLLNQFLSPLINFREDDYGRDRLKYPLEVFCAIREALGDYPLAVRIGGVDDMPGGTRICDGVDAAVAFEKAGACFLDISGGMRGFTRPENKEAGWYSDLSEAVKERATVPVVLTGGIKTYDEAEKLLKEEKADLIGIGRAFLKNPNWEMARL